jgi:hypothetical protein
MRGRRERIDAGAASGRRSRAERFIVAIRDQRDTP